MREQNAALLALREPVQAPSVAGRFERKPSLPRRGCRQRTPAPAARRQSIRDAWMFDLNDMNGIAAAPRFQRGAPVARSPSWATRGDREIRCQTGTGGPRLRGVTVDREVPDRCPQSKTTIVSGGASSPSSATTSNASWQAASPLQTGQSPDELGAGARSGPASGRTACSLTAPWQIEDLSASSNAASGVDAWPLGRCMSTPCHVASIV